MARYTLKIDGMGCQSCVARVRRALEAVPGVTVEKVEVGSARVAADPSVAPESVAGAVSQAGYPATAQAVG